MKEKHQQEEPKRSPPFFSKKTHLPTFRFEPCETTFLEDSLGITGVGSNTA